MATKPKSTPVLAVWPHKENHHRAEQYWGSVDYVNHGDSVTSTWLFLRAISPDRWTNTETDAWSDLGIYVWLDVDGTVMLDLRLHEARSLDLAAVQYRAKLMAKLIKKVQKNGYPLGSFARSINITTELLRLFDAIGIDQAVRYQPGVAEDRLELVSPHLLHIGTQLSNRVAGMRAQRVAA